MADPALEPTYFSRRLAETRRAEELTASIQFDLARSGLDDQQLEDIVGSFMAEAPTGGIGIADVMHDMLSKVPNRVATPDLETLQRQLQYRGYAPPDAPITGQWDSSWYGAMKRFDRDNYDLQRSGKSWNAGTLLAGVNMLAQTLPSNVWQNLVGWSKGFIEHTPEALENLGLLGGAAAGAAIGTAILPGAGSLVGGAAGAILGFAADILGEDEGEVQQEGSNVTWSEFVDALSPWTEYKNDHRQFWEDVGWVATAASVIGGVKMGVAGAGGVLGGIRASAGAPMAGAPWELANVTGKATSLWAPQAVRPELGIIGSLSRAAIKKFAPNSTGALVQAIERVSPMGLASRIPALQVGNKMYTGLATASVGVKATAGLGQGARDLNEEVRAQLAAKQASGAELTEEEQRVMYEGVGVSDIEKAITREKAPLENLGPIDILPGFELPMMLDEVPNLLDLSAFVLWPERLLPFAKGTIGSSARVVMGSERGAQAWIEFIRRGENLTFEQGRALAKELVTPEVKTHAMVDFGIKEMVKDQLRARGPIAEEKLWLESRRLEHQIRARIDAEGPGSPTAAAALRRMQGREYLLGAYLDETLAPGRTGVEQIKAWQEGQELVYRAQDEVQRFMYLDNGSGLWVSATRRYPVDVPLARGGGVIRQAGEAHLPTGRVKQGGLGAVERSILKDEATKLESEIKALERRAQSPKTTPDAGRRMLQEAEMIRLRLEAVSDALAHGKGSIRMRMPDEYRVMLARKDYVTRRKYYDLRKEYLALREQVKAAAKTGYGDAAHINAQASMERWLQDQLGAGIMPEKIAMKGRGANPTTKPADWLESLAREAADEVVIPQAAIASKADELGYKFVLTGDKVLMPAEMSRLMEVTGIGDYSRRTWFFDSLGLRPDKVLDEDIWRFRQATERAELQQAIEANNLPIKAADLQSRLYGKLAEQNHSGVVKGPFAVAPGGKVSLYRVDVRSLRPDEVLGALDDVPGMTRKAAMDVYGALKRGAALGGEVKLRSPVESAHTLGRAMRASGLVGFSDAIRTWHTKNPFEWESPRFGESWVYRPHARFARSEARMAVDERSKALVGSTKLTEQDRQLGMFTLDTIADGAVAAGTAKSVDDFYKMLDIDSAARWMDESFNPRVYFQRLFDDFMPELTPSTLGKRGQVTPETTLTGQALKRLETYLARYEDSPLWYEESGQAIRQVFGGRRVKLADGKTVTMDDFVARMVAVTSGGNEPRPNLTVALKAIRKYLDDPDYRYSDASEWKPGRDKTLVNKVLDGWAPDTPKFGPFYKALMGDQNAVVVDRRMAFMFGFFKKDKNGKWVSTANASEQEFIRRQIRALAKRTGLAPAVVQERLWIAFPEYFKDLARIADPNFIRVEGAGWRFKKRLAEQAKMFNEIANGINGSDNFAELLSNPKWADMAGEIMDLSKGHSGVFFKRVENQIIGATILGEDGMRTLRLMADGDFSTFAHEAGHLLRTYLPENAVQDIERYFKVRDVPISPAAAEEFGSLRGLEGGAWKKSWRRMHQTISPDDGGATWNPRTGEFIEFSAEAKQQFLSAVNVGNAATISVSKAISDPAWFRAQIRAFVREHEDRYTSENIYVGLWHKPGTDDLAIDISTSVPKGEDALELGVRYRQESVADARGPKFYDVPEWSPNQHEEFARMLESFITKQRKPPSEVRRAFEWLRGSLGSLWGKGRGWAVESGETSPAVRKMLDEWFGPVMNLRPKSTMQQVGTALVSRQITGGAALGAAAGAWEGRGDGVFDGDMIEGAAYGALGGLGLRKALGRTYGYLPDALTRMNTALRYTLSFTFDAGRYMEQNTIAMAKYGLPPMFSPRRYIGAGREFKSPYRSGVVSGDDAWRDTVRFWDELNGTSYFHNIDDIDRRMYQAGILGFQPRNWEAAQAMMLYQRGWGADKIKEAISNIGRYGVGRAAAEKSANFVFFPFSFSKKYLETLGDFILAAPGRNLLVYEGLRRYHESSLDEKFDDFITDHAPLLQQLWRVNNLAFGISPGRFFLEGLGDNRTASAHAAFILASTLVPSGAATPLAQAAGTAADLGINGFVPVVLSGESIDRLGGIDGLSDVVQRYIPFTREVEDYWQSVSEQKTSLLEGAVPWAQFTEMSERLREAKAEYEPMAAALGYSSVDGFLNSTAGTPAKMGIDALQNELRRQYPTGFRLSTELANQNAIAEAQAFELSQKPNRSGAEDAILQLLERQSFYANLPTLAGMPPETVDAIASRYIREEAMKWVGDQRFNELYSLFFEREFGPIRRIA